MLRLFESAICKRSVFQFSLDEIAVQVRDVDDGLVLRALSLASAGVGAVTEAQLNLLPQGKPEALRRAKAMLSKMDELGFGNCTNTRACEAECPKNESIINIAHLNRDFIWAKLKD